MGKAKKIKPSKIGSKIPLEEDIESSKFARSKNRNKIRLRQDEDEQVRSINFQKINYSMHLLSF